MDGIPGKFKYTRGHVSSYTINIYITKCDRYTSLYDLSGIQTGLTVMPQCIGVMRTNVYRRTTGIITRRKTTNCKPKNRKNYMSEDLKQRIKEFNEIKYPKDK